ncbi:HPF/RaiA family ribosome-associated protein [Streptomyces sp. SCUT-3]|uniref:ribosome hibernation promotion factor n=1 Tax=Streptomyces sp. SCUT-3 TaxID=2684469 RepID=UPI000CAFE641|nr:sigma 54 modulation/S30EA ribosomal C-terminal domain-containing protein [Streptomyces sp. SCUT-3]PLW65987.1 hypothetical protein C0036_25160 [Streptomyces sp. DJ]QMV22618.1 HPF/RaiA family ribosome-associated protein [Streptomyces sp. SCUT-3]
MKRSTVRQTPEIQVEVRGEVPEDSVEYARSKVQELAGQLREPVLFARVRLTRTANPATERPAIAQANLDVNGRQVRAHVASGTMSEAVDLPHDRLVARMRRTRQDWEARRGGMPTKEPHEWRHDSEPTHRPDYFPRPVEERQVVRHKSFSLARETPDEAVYEMEEMDYDFHLFTDAGSGEDSVVYRDGPDGYRLAQVRPSPDRIGPVSVPLTVSGLPAPRMNVEEAEKRLDLAGFPFVFFTDGATGRGNVLYHRYDGHYGLIAPVE